MSAKLFAAAENGNIGAVQRALSEGADINARSTKVLRGPRVCAYAARVWAVRCVARMRVGHCRCWRALVARVGPCDQRGSRIFFVSFSQLVRVAIVGGATAKWPRT